MSGIYSVKTPGGVEYDCRQHVISDSWALEVDRLYLVADAELTSDKATYDHALMLISSKPCISYFMLRLIVPSLARFMFWKVREMAVRDGLYASLSQYGCRIVARQCAEDWVTNADPGVIAVAKA